MTSFTDLDETRLYFMDKMFSGYSSSGCSVSNLDKYLYFAKETANYS